MRGRGIVNRHELGGSRDPDAAARKFHESYGRRWTRPAPDPDPPVSGFGRWLRGQVHDAHRRQAR